MVSYVLMPNYRGDPLICQSARPFSRTIPANSSHLPTHAQRGPLLWYNLPRVAVDMDDSKRSDRRGRSGYAEFLLFLCIACAVSLGSWRLRGI